MGKIARLLDEVTIINFQLIYKLLVRYKSHLVLSLILFVAIFNYFYFNQPVIYSSSIPMKVIGKNSLSNELSILRQKDNSSIVSIGELSSMISSYSFIKMLAAEIIKNPQFKKMNFGSIANGSNVFGNELLNNCKGQTECTLDALTNYLGGLYLLEQGLTNDRFKLTIHALNEVTSQGISKSLVGIIEKKRIEIRQFMIIKEINSVTNLINESRTLLDKQNSSFLVEEEEKNSQTIVELKEKLKFLQRSLTVELENMSSLQGKIVESRSFLNKRKNVDGFNKTKSRLTQQKIAELRSNIVAFSNIPEANRSKADAMILEQLKGELKNLEGKIPAEESLRSQEIEETFGDSQRAKENDFKFDYLVSKNKVASLEADSEGVRQKLDELQKNKGARDAVVSKIKADMEFIKTLEAKLLSLKLMNSTMSSDLQFEESGNNISMMRELSILKTFVFSLLITLFSMFFSLIGRYLWDDKIYSEDDILPYLKDLDFIGEAPTFE